MGVSAANGRAAGARPLEIAVGVLQCAPKKAKNSANGGSSARQPITPDTQV